MLLLVDHLGVAGPGRQAALLAAGIRPGFSSQVAAGAVPGDDAGPPEGVPVHHVPLAGAVHPTPDIDAATAVHRLLMDTRAVILHTHSQKAGAVGRLTALGAARPPLIVHSFHADVLEGHEVAPAGASRHDLLELERRMARRSDVLVVPTVALRDELVSLRIGRAEQYEVIPLGLDVRRYRAVAGDRGELRRAIGVAGDVPLAGVFGPLEAQVDHLVLVRALSALAEVHLAVLGGGEEAAAMQQAAGSLGLADRVHASPAWRDRPGALADLDVVVSAEHGATTPEALVEALAAGRPVVAADAPGPRAVVDERRGWLCPPGDPAAFARALGEVIERPIEAMARAATGRRVVADQHSAERLVAAHVALYRSLLAGAG